MSDRTISPSETVNTIALVKKRRLTHAVRVENLLIGGGAPVLIQSMTNTNTEDIDKTVAQCAELALAGSELVRITVNTPLAAQAVPQIKAELERASIHVPLVGDFHFNGHRLLADFPACAQALAKYRINPGNVGHGAKRDEQFAQMIQIACRYDKPVRIGVNWGSLDQELLARLMDENSRQPNPMAVERVMREAMIVSAIDSARQAVLLGLPEDHIVLSCKVSGVQELIALYRELSRRCDYALHLGLTEAGMGSKGIVASTAAMGVLLEEGIGDTIRVSLTPKPDESRTHEVIVAQQMLQTMGLRAFMPMVTACPGCGRTSSTLFQELALAVQEHVEGRMRQWQDEFEGVENMTLAVMGCVVNGPGESKHANVGISLPGNGEMPAAPVFEDGVKTVTLRGEHITEEFKAIIDRYVARTYRRKVIAS